MIPSLLCRHLDLCRWEPGLVAAAAILQITGTDGCLLHPGPSDAGLCSSGLNPTQLHFKRIVKNSIDLTAQQNSP